MVNTIYDNDKLSLRPPFLSLDWLRKYRRVNRTIDANVALSWVWNKCTIHGVRRSPVTCPAKMRANVSSKILTDTKSVITALSLLLNQNSWTLLHFIILTMNQISSKSQLSRDVTLSCSEITNANKFYRLTFVKCVLRKSNKPVFYFDLYNTQSKTQWPLLNSRYHMKSSR